MATRRDVLEIRLFGGLALFFDGEQLPPLPSRHARLLFARLAMHAGRPQPRSVLADLLWPELPEARGRRRLSHALWQVQDVTGAVEPGRPYLLTPGDAVVFDADAPYELDVEEFEQRLDSVDHARALDGPNVRHLRRCVELYHGDLLAGSYEGWVITEQERLRQRYISALGLLVESAKQRGSFEDALAFARRLTHEAPLREDAHREVMRLCVLLGQPSQALAQFERCRSVLAEELGARPSAATAELHDQITRSRVASTSVRPRGAKLVSPRLVARDAERITLVDQLERTLGGRSGMVFVEGEPGIGKTELLAQAADDARWRGFTVMWGACEGPDVPYSVVRSALEGELDDVRVAQLRAHVEPVWLQQAGRLLRPLAGGPAASAATTATAPGLVQLDGSDGAERMREALAQVIAGLAAIDPVALILEDAHRADEDTFALLRALSRIADPGRLLVILSFRDVDARAVASVWDGLRAVDRDARPVRVRLEPMTPFETAALLQEVLGAPQVPPAFTEAVHREGGGNPLYVLELLRALRDDGTLGADRDELEHVPVPVTDGLRTLIADRLDHLDAGAASVVALGAVLGSEFDIATLEAGSTLADLALATALGELSRRNLLDVDGERCRFAHAVTRRVVLERLEADEVQQLHATAATALEETCPDQVEALAAHLRAAGEPRRALRYLRLAAARAVELHAYASAAAHLLAAVEVAATTMVDVDDHVDILLQLESVLDVLGRRDEQATTLEDLAALAEGNVERTVEVSLRWAGHLALVDRFEEAARVAAHAVELTDGEAQELRGRALTAQGRVLSWAGDNAEAARVLTEATRLVAGRDAGRAGVALGTALRQLQRFDEARDVLDAALIAAETTGDHAAVVLALGSQADLRAETGRTGEAVVAHRRAVELARTIGFRHREGVGQVNLGTVLLTRGDPGPALVAYDGAEAVFRSLGNQRGVAMVQLNRGWLHHRWLGQSEAATRDATAAHAYFQRIGSRGLVAVCAETLAGIAREHGDLTAAGNRLDEGLAAARAASDQRAEVQIGRGRAELALAADDPPAAAAAASRALGSALSLGLEEFVADLATLHALAVSLGADGATPDARSAARSADLDLALGHVATSAEPHRIHHRVATLYASVGDDAAARRHGLDAARLLSAALASVEQPAAQTAVSAVAEHREIVATGARIAPRLVQLTAARADAPRGRPLVADELVAIALELPPPPESPSDRRAQLLQVLQRVESSAAQATVEDLASTLSVSTSTIRRDLRALRSEGHHVVTRGAHTG